MSPSSWTRVTGATGIPFVAALVVAVTLNSDTPDDQSSDDKILDYYASHSHRVQDITTLFVMLVGLIFLIWFIGHLCSVVHATAGDGRATSIAAVSGGSLVALFAVLLCIVVAPSVAITDAGDKFTLDPDTFRLLDTVGFIALLAAFMLGAPLAFTIGVVAWRTGVLPRWLAVVSFLGGLGGLLSVSFFTIFIYLAWILALSVYLTWRPAGAPEAPGPPIPTAATP